MSLTCDSNAPVGSRPTSDDGDITVANGRRQVFLQSGHVFASGGPVAITTILGSSVCVAMYDAKKHIGGTCHYILPRAPQASDQPLRFGDLAIRKLIEEVLSRGALKGSLRASILGGASVNEPSPDSVGHGLGAENVAIAKEVLGNEGIPIQTEDVGGNLGRRLTFCTDNGTSTVRSVEGISQ